MGNYYQHPFRSFEGGANAQSQPSAAPDVQAAPVAAPAPSGGADDGSERGNPILSFLFQGSNAKFTIPAIFILLSAAYIFIYDSVTAYSSSGSGLSRRAKGSSANEAFNEEELSDRAFESSHERGTWRPPSDEGMRSVDEARNNAGFFGRLFCGGLKRSRWCQ